MAIVDIILKVDHELRLKEIIYMGESKKWFSDKTLYRAIGEKLDYIIGTSITSDGGIIEIENKFFKYQWIEEKNGGTLYLSRDGVLLDLYEQTIKQVAEGIQIFDKNGYFIYGNPASEKLEQYKNEDFKGKHVLELYDLREEYSTILTVLRTQNPVASRCDRFKVKNGKTLTTINSGYPLKIKDRIYGAVVFESDLSVLKQIKKRTFNLENYVESNQSPSDDSLYTFDDIVHTSKGMKDIIYFGKKVSLTDSSVLVVGATGTGKELIAQSIHSFSPRRHKPFIDVNCGAVPYNLFESMFFGTEKGAFTGSVTKKGFFEMADGGTIFLDEINSISMEMQAKLLRVLQEKRFQRIGGTKYIQCDVRIIAASNEDFFQLMEEQKVRQDFYYRISTIKINIPPLQERREDIPILAEYFLKNLCNQYNRREIIIAPQALTALLEYSWPGNVRELQHVIEYGFNRASEETEILEFQHLPDYIQSSKSYTHKTAQLPKEFVSEVTDTNPKNFQEQMELYERRIIIDSLILYKGNITQSAKTLGMSRQSLQYRMKKLGISNM
ncbi:sigma-54 interaction domain-containing protein [Natronincola ferrireducens]|uniref:Arginine utilization regulatory protein n=1 Tax=Natronincola ferrireducens TaxID=393762 RepID=A0A1G9EC09_9FIRM|nr:sigma 54-interacting transcriptional regulator [Natronincola ferrireducens]SDK73575.1 arginine utilization regulatory protein [Natronincola ferrireducens]